MRAHNTVRSCAASRSGRGERLATFKCRAHKDLTSGEKRFVRVADLVSARLSRDIAHLSSAHTSSTALCQVAASTIAHNFRKTLFQAHAKQAHRAHAPIVCCTVRGATFDAHWSARQ